MAGTAGRDGISPEICAGQTLPCSTADLQQIKGLKDSCASSCFPCLAFKAAAVLGLWDEQQLGVGHSSLQSPPGFQSTPPVGVTLCMLHLHSGQKLLYYVSSS